MAIQVNGTQVIGNSRELTNIASVDATTAASITAAGVGGGGLSAWDPGSTPDATFTSSGTWTKPSGISSSALVIFYLVGGGGGGSKASARGGRGGSAAVITGILGDLPSSVSIVVGAGGAGQTQQGYQSIAGGDTTISASGLTYTASGGSGDAFDGTDTSAVTDLAFPDSTNPFAVAVPNSANLTAGNRGITGGSLSGHSSTFGGGFGGQTNPNINGAGGTSLYAGNGGAGIYYSNSAPGIAPGGGGGGAYSYSSRNGGAGADGSVRIWYIT